MEGILLPSSTHGETNNGKSYSLFFLSGVWLNSVFIISRLLRKNEGIVKKRKVVNIITIEIYCKNMNFSCLCVGVLM